MKYLVGLILGIVLHMGYLDLAFTVSLKKADDCMGVVEAFDLDTAMCRQVQRETLSNFKGKYFNLALLRKYQNIVVQPWTME